MRVTPPWTAVLAVVVTGLLAGCATLPEPDGLEAAIIEKASGLDALTPEEGSDPKSVARNGLLMHPSVREAAGEVAASADEVRIERAALFPGLSLGVVGGVGDAGSGDAALELEGSQLLFDGGNTRRAVKVADFDLQIDFVTFQQTVDEVLVELLSAYDDVQLQTDLLRIYRKQLAAFRELEGLVARRVENGAASTTDLLETRRSMQSAEFLVADAELALGEAQDRLMLLAGQTRGGALDIAPASCRARGETDDMRIARLEMARAELVLEKAELARVPRVTLQPIVRHEFGTGRLPVGLDVGVQSDLLQGGAIQAGVNAAQNSLLAAKAKLRNAELEDSLEERKLRRSLAAGERKAAMLNRQIDLLAETRELYRSQYFDMGTRQLSELLDNEEEYYDRQAELAELRSELALDRLDCAVRSRVLRRELGLERVSLYGFPMATDFPATP